jgi:hypothetical protein
MIKVDSIVTIMHAAGNNTFSSSLILTSFITIACSPKYPSCMHYKAMTENGTAKQYCMLHKNKPLSQNNRSNMALSQNNRKLNYIKFHYTNLAHPGVKQIKSSLKSQSIPNAKQISCSQKL